MNKHTKTSKQQTNRKHRRHKTNKQTNEHKNKIAKGKQQIIKQTSKQNKQNNNTKKAK